VGVGLSCLHMEGGVGGWGVLVCVPFPLFARFAGVLPLLRSRPPAHSSPVISVLPVQLAPLFAKFAGVLEEYEERRAERVQRTQSEVGGWVWVLRTNGLWPWVGGFGWTGGRSGCSARSAGVDGLGSLYHTELRCACKPLDAAHSRDRDGAP